MSFVDGPVLAVAIDPGRLAAGIVDSDGEILVRDRVSTPPREIWRSLETLVSRVLAARPDDLPPPISVGVSCVGPLDLAAGSVTPELMPAWIGFALRDRLELLTGLPVVLDSAAGAAAEAERLFGDATEVRSFLTLMLGRTVESACVIDEVRLRGAHGNAGSLAHLTVEPDGLTCTCGASGCLSAYASSTSIEAEIKRPLRRATDSIIDRTGIMIGRAIASSAAMFEVSTFLLSGVVLDTFGDPLLESIRREVDLRSQLAASEKLRVLESSGFIRSLVAAASLPRSIDT